MSLRQKYSHSDVISPPVGHLSCSEQIHEFYSCYKIIFYTASSINNYKMCNFHHDNLGCDTR